MDRYTKGISEFWEIAQRVSIHLREWCWYPIVNNQYADRFQQSDKPYILQAKSIDYNEQSSSQACVHVEVNQLCSGGLDAHDDSECSHSPSQCFWLGQNKQLMPGPVVSIFQDFYISYDPNQRIGSSLWAICVCEASGLAKLFMPVLLRGKDKLIGESDRALCFEGRSLVWSYIRGGPIGSCK